MKFFIKKWLVMIVWCCLLATGLFAQQLTEQDLLLNTSDLIDPDLDGNGNETYLTQIGNRNEVGVIQNLQGAAVENLVRVLQAGNRNTAQINMEGHLNQTILLQDGTRNEYSLNLVGAENTFLIRQQGDGNVINQNLTNTNQMYIELVQVGNDNEIMHNQSGLANSQIIVRQVGDGMNLIINQSN